MYRGAVQAILSELVRQDRLVVVESFELAQPKTSELIEKLAGLDFTTGLVIADEIGDNVFLASRNLPGVYVMDVAAMDPVSLVGAERVIMTVAAVEKVQEWLG
jgi:large subunit ribosomal protein L4